MTIEAFIASLPADARVKASGARGWSCRCPAHEDREASLSIGVGGEGRILLKCFAGCTADAICHALKLTLKDLMPDKTAPPRAAAKSRPEKVVATYNYLDEHGQLLYRKLRYEPKTFRIQRPDPEHTGQWLWGLNSTRKILYRLPELIAAIKDERPIFAVEGERDVDVLYENGFPATCNPMGAAEDWSAEYTSWFPDAEVIVIADKDDAGRVHVRSVADSIKPVVKSVKTIELPDRNGHKVKDAADWFAAGGQPAEFDELVQAPQALAPGELPEWVDAATFCAAPCPPPIQIIKHILHQGCKLVFGGPSKARKTWVLLDLAISVSTGQKWLSFDTTAAPVLFVNFELPKFSIHDRLISIARAKNLTLPPPGQLVIWNLRSYSAPYDVLLPKITSKARHMGFGLIVLDPSYKLLGEADENSTRDIAKLLNALDQLTLETNASLAFSAHFAKGNAALKESIDRISGSGVFARDPDAILTATPLQTEGTYVIDPILRTVPPHKPITIRWDYPIFRVDDELDADDLKRPKTRNAKPIPTNDEFLALFRDLPNDPRKGLMTASELRVAFDRNGWERTSAPALRDTLEGQGALKTHYAAHNQKLTGLPHVVDAYQKQIDEAQTLLAQPALPTS